MWCSVVRVLLSSACLCGRNLAGQQEHCRQWCLYPVCDTMLCTVCGRNLAGHCGQWCLYPMCDTMLCTVCGRNLAGHCGQWCLYPVCDTMLCAVCVAETWLDSRSTVIPTPTAGVWWDMPSCVPFWPICVHSCHKLASNSQVTYISSLHTFSHLWLYCLCAKTIMYYDFETMRQFNVLWFETMRQFFFP